MKKNLEAEKLAKKLLGEPEIPKASRSFQFQHKKPLPRPPPLQRKNLTQSAKIEPQAERKIPLEQIHCSHNQRYPLFYLEMLKQRKVDNSEAKEQLIALRNLKSLANELQKWIYSHLNKRVDFLKNKPIEFYDLIEKRQERHYQVDRIIRYLSDMR